MVLRFGYCSIVLLAALGAFSLTALSSVVPVHTQVRPALQQGPVQWVLDKAHSNVKFTVTHMLVTETEGSFRIFDGSVENTKPDLSDAIIQFSVNVNSINTNNENRDRHLKSDDFFNAGKYPQMKFVSTAFTPAGENKYKLTGNLTIRDVTKPVTFEVTGAGTGQDKRTTTTGFTAITVINRFDYGLKWDKATETGGLIVSKEVTITVNVALKRING